MIFFFFFFLTLTIHAQSQSNYHLHPTDHNALIHIHKHFDLNIPHPPSNLCNSSAGIFCESHHKSHLPRVTRLVFESRRLQGQLSPHIGQLSELRHLSLRDNRITHQIPSEIGLCRKLELLDLSSNNFVGKIPPSLRSCPNLRFINVSGNSLMDDQNLSSEFGMPKRYFYAESSRSQAPAPSAATTIHKEKSRKKKAVEWILRFLSGILAGGVSGLVFMLLIKLIVHVIRRNKSDTRLRIFSPMIKRPEDLAFLDRENGLTSLEIIGRGGCGEVYKTALPGSSGIEIAVKKIIPLPVNGGELTEEDSKMLTRKMRQIKSEIQTVGQIRHRNLLPLLAHLPRSNCHYLVYEYMKNGSLQDYLRHVANGQKELDWLGRQKIAVGIAAGLEYLHISHNPRIIHRDLKPGNILLDDEMEARIADFGLAKAVPDANTHVTTSNVAGTVGYIAPEYYQTFKFTDKCDIYSFGMVLGVLVVGKMPSDEFFQQTDEMSMVQWMRNVMTSEDPKRAIDPKLLGKGYEDQMLLVLKVACFCTMDNPIERPNSRDVRCMLSQIKY